MSPPLRLLVATDMYCPPSTMGGAIAARRWAVKLAERGHEVLVVTPSGSAKGGWGEDGAARTLRVPSLPLPHPRREIRSQYRLLLWRPGAYVRAAMDRLRPHVVHVHFSMLLGLAAVAQARRRGLPVLGTNHSLPENSLYVYGREGAESVRRSVPGLYRLSEGLWWRALAGFYSRCDVMTAPTPTMVALYQKNGVTAPTAQVSNGIDTAVFARPARVEDRVAEFRRRFEIPEGRRVVLYAGRMDPEKRVDVLLDGFAQLLESVKVDVQLVIAGRRDAAMEARMARMGLSSRITLCGFLDAERDLPIAYHAADVLASASECEGQGLVFLEGMAAGLPVVAADRYAVRDTVLHGETGFLFPPGRSDDLARRLAELLTDEPLRRRLGERARAHAASHDIEPVLDRLEQILHGMAVRR